MKHSLQQRRSYINQSGFSLIEVLVSLSIFTFVSVTAVGVLLVMVDANRKAQNVQSVMTNMSFALDSMTRELRTGTHYHCENAASSASLPVSGDSVNDCTQGSRISFREAGNSLTEGCSSDRIGYRFNGVTNAIERRLCDESWIPITAPNVTVTDFRLVVTGTTDGDVNVPVVTVYVAGESGSKLGTVAKFNLQTTVTQYTLDI